MRIKQLAIKGLAGIAAFTLFLFPSLMQATGIQEIMQPTPAGEQVVLFNRAETWKYFDQGVEPEPAWIRADFDDSGWVSGQAPLGYGDVGAATTIDSGPNPASKYITTYFRKTFTVTDPGILELVNLELHHSDGVFVYLNGSMLDYPHMGSLGPSYSAYSIACDNGETDMIAIDPGSLVAGENVLSVEVHTCKPDSAYLLLDAGMSATRRSGSPAPGSAQTAKVSSLGGSLLFNRGQYWRFYDTGQIPNANWMAAGFDDSGWNGGWAPLGYGGMGEKTTVNYGPDPAARFKTTYFRKDFYVLNPYQVQALALEIVANDGVVVYLNGAQIAHPNMPPGGIGYETTPTGCGNAIVTKMRLPNGLLVPGKNVLALEQHQCDPTAETLTVDASMAVLLNNGQPIPAGFPTEMQPRERAAAQSGTSAALSAAPLARLPEAPQGQQWSLRWADEFDGAAVNTSVWQINDLARKEDPNKTWYLPRNVTVSDGTLKLIVKEEDYNGVKFTGGMLESTGDYRRNRYGYYEARIKYDFIGPGFWANFWMSGVDRWPPEFDNEVVTHQIGQVYLANHYRDATARHRSTNIFIPLDYNQWHTYGVLWLPGQPVRFYVDDKLAFTAESPAENPPVIDMYVSLRAGAYYNSSWGGAPDGTTRYPGTVEYDYVRVYEAMNP